MTILISIIILGYVGLLGIYRLGWSKQVRADFTDRQISEMVSIIVPARNEEDNIVSCITSLLEQDFAGDYEVILVDDHSEDNTISVVENHFADDPRLKIIRLVGRDKGKKSALQEGINVANGEVIATVDADCRVGEKWLEAAMSEFDYGVKAATGPVLIREAGNEVEGFQALDLMSLALVTGGGYYMGLHMLGNGANLFFRKNAFDSVGGYRRGWEFASGDDLFLIQSIAGEYGVDSIAYLPSSESVVWTVPEASTEDLIRQRVRWASKNGGLPDRSIQLIWAFVWMANLAALALVALSVTEIVSMQFALICILAKGIAEFFCLKAVADHYSLTGILRRWFALGFLLNTAYVTYIGLKAMFSNAYTWKGRRMN